MTALPSWLDPLYEAAEMRAADAWAIDEMDVPQDDLMARAALGLARVAATYDSPVRVVVGKGNNGGDGLVAARLLREDGFEVDVIDGTEPFDPSVLEGSGVVLDCLLGTGFEGEPREPVASAIWAINRQGAPVVACDVPSGVNASTGEVEGEAVRAEATATFHGSKIGLYVEPGKGYAGSVEEVEIGIPRGAPEPDGGRASSRSGSSTCIPTGRAAARSSSRAWSSWWAARWGSPEHRRWPPGPLRVREPGTSRWPCRGRCSRRWTSGCWSR